MNHYKKNRLYALAVFLLTAGCMVFLYLIVLRLPHQYTRLDLSANGLHSLSEDSCRAAKELTEPADLYLICATGKEDGRLVNLLEQYARLNPLIHTDHIDPALHPEFVPCYTTNQLPDNSIIVVGKDRNRVIRRSDIYVSAYDYDTGKTTASFDGEGQITSALHYVADGNASCLYVLSGHGEPEISDTLNGMMGKEGMITEKWNLKVTGAVPDRCDGLILFGPSSDLSETEMELLLDYLENGGKLFLVTGVRTEPMPNMDMVLSAYGVAWEDGVVVEGNGNYHVPSYASYLLPELISHEITDPLIREEAMVLQPQAHGIRILEECRETVRIAGLTSATDQSFTAEGEKGPFITAAAIQETIRDRETRIVWFACYPMVTDEVDQIVGGSNMDLILNGLAWLTQRENGMTIRAKTISEATLVTTSAQAAIWGSIFVLILPVMFMAAGFCICAVRKRRT